MDGVNLLPVFLVGLAGSVHCIGMCGGIVGALSAAPGAAKAAGRVIPIAAAPAPLRLAAPAMQAMPCTPAAQHAPAAAVAGGAALRLLAYNTGRIGSYMLAGAIAGGLAGGAASLSKAAFWQNAAFLLANLMLVALGLYLMNAWRGLSRLEAAGGALWKRLQPLLRPLLPMDSPAKALALGGLWGWVPCAMVYSVLLTAALSGSAARGAAVMLAFGLGTLPMLAALGALGLQVRQLLQRRAARTACGLLVLAFGLLGLLRASGAAAPLLHALGMPDATAAHGWLDALCIGTRP
ncbi:cytochrome biogenesis protein [Massilia sp. Root351]|jgi:sulfite exporter TauE/SafE|uniref:sulfite exporter TauE/SafE family protein n=1 Tax=Massilia sp. Root351 TaxID=1736522 RepID=UPI00070C8D60|nr:sulfite exporter TauE/SafE family protein [Massilia sp. Root351]KQV90007.1 cytochrome biogenesis protein [Massilia sp. Root351]